MEEYERLKQAWVTLQSEVD
jgi:hypothetical protein